jgi:hypothetical protein
MEVGDWKKTEELVDYHMSQSDTFESMWTFENMSAEGIRNITMKNKPHINQVLKLPVNRFGKEGDLMFLYNNFIIILKSKKKISVRVNEFVKIRITKVLPTFALAVLADK